MSEDNSEKRRAIRKPLRVDAFVTVNGNQRVSVRTLDISVGGLAIVCEINPPMGMKVEVDLAVPLRTMGYVPIKVSARVVHAIFSSSEGGFKVGLNFNEVPPRAAQIIAAFMK